MKRIALLSTLGFALWQMACNPPSPLETKKKELAALKENLLEVQNQIELLEKEIATLDTSKASSLKTRFVSVEPLKKGTFKHFIEVQGTVEADNNVLATPDQPGVVTKVLVKEGQQVNAGQLLAELENTALKRGLEEAEAALDLANETYLRTKSLWDQKIGSELQYLQAKSNFESMKQRVKGLEAQLDMTRIEAPVTGTVDAVLVKPGEMASPGVNGVRVVNLNHLKIVAAVADAFVGTVKPGLPVEVVFPDLNLTMHKTIAFVSRVVDPGNRSVTIEADLSGCDCAIRPNMVGSLRINDITQDSVLLVPSNLIQVLPEGKFVMTAQKDPQNTKVAKRIPIVSGMEYGGTTVIADGLSEGTLIITAGNTEVVNNQPIAY